MPIFHPTLVPPEANLPEPLGQPLHLTTSSSESAAPQSTLISQASEQLLQLKQTLASRQAVQADSPTTADLPDTKVLGQGYPSSDRMSSNNMPSPAAKQEAKDRLKQLEQQLATIQQNRSMSSTRSSSVGGGGMKATSHSRSPSPLGRPPSMDVPSQSMTSSSSPNVKMQDLLSQASLEHIFVQFLFM